MVKREAEYKDVFLSPAEAQKQADSNTLLCVVDTSRPEQLDDPELLKLCGNFVYKLLFSVMIICVYFAVFFTAKITYRPTVACSDTTFVKSCRRQEGNSSRRQNTDRDQPVLKGKRKLSVLTRSVPCDQGNGSHILSS